MKRGEKPLFLLFLTIRALVCYNMCICKRKDRPVKKISLKKLLPRQKTVCYLLSTLFLTIGVYLAYPVHGIVATFPLCFLFSAFAYVVSPHLSVHLGSTAAIAFFYGLTTDFYDPFSFAFFCAGGALCAALLIRLIRSFSKGKKLLLSLGAVLLVAAGIALPIIFSGTPSAFLEARKDTEQYLSTTYPQQKFEEVTVYYNLRERCYAAEVEYLFEGNDLTSTILFSQKMEDGFRDDFVSWMQEKRKSLLIDVVKKSSEDVLINSAGLAQMPKDGVFHGSYGVFGTEMEPLFHFSATFREEKPQRRDFADACRAVMATAEENNFDYGSITFYALDAGNVVYECTVTPETDPELVLSLVKYAN